MTFTMTLKRPLLSTLILAGLTVPAFAQTARTGTGGGPQSTARAGNVTTTGQTKPPSRGASPADRSRSDEVPAGETTGGISKGICIGCDAK